MEFEEKDIAYPPVHPGTERTFIRFYSGEPDLNSIFYPFSSQDDDKPQRIFVTDTKVASLPQLKPFVDFFRDENFARVNAEPGYMGKRGKDLLLILGSGETFKTIESVLSICRAATESNAQRSAVFVGIGGGVITDMTAFAASIFKRGASLELVPTTLLSMVDAAIGGKTGCDFDTYKNMIGTFFPAQKIHIIPSFISTLPDSEYRSGLAEVVKTALLYSKTLFEKLAATPDILTDRKNPLAEEMIKTCVSAKAAVVEKDLTETGIRKQLNLGHTFGHALESRAGLGRISHGDAVAWGIARAAELSRKLGLCTDDYVNRIKTVLTNYGWETEPLHSVIKGKYKTDEDAAEALYSAMRKDKKNTSEKVTFVLQKDICKTVITEADKGTVLSVLA